MTRNKEAADHSFIRICMFYKKRDSTYISTDALKIRERRQVVNTVCTLRAHQRNGSRHSCRYHQLVILHRRASFIVWRNGDATMLLPLVARCSISSLPMWTRCLCRCPGIVRIVVRSGRFYFCPVPVWVSFDDGFLIGSFDGCDGSCCHGRHFA